MTEASRTSLLDVERLQQLSYERSTKWANFLDSIAVSENQDVIDIADFERVYDEDLEDQNELASMEDESCDDKSLDSDVLRDITNSTRLALMLSNHNKTSKLSDTTIIQDENHELVDLFNQTMPVINEHNRQMKESGFDRILNTFDAKKIEEKVGGWLRRHNSLCTPDFIAAVSANHKENPRHFSHQTVACRSAAAKPYRTYRDDETDSDDSLHSGETARYIRSSRVGALKNSSSTTMMIKTYRMVKSTRQALKDKYACAQDDDAEVHLNKLRHRRRIANEVEILHSNEKHLIRSHKPKNQYKTPSHASHTSQKRKVLRKRSASNSCSAMDTSSESDNAYSRGTADKYYHRRHKCCGERHKFIRRRHAVIASDVVASVKRSHNRETKRTPYSRRDHIYCYEQTHSHSISSSSSVSSTASFTDTCKMGGRKCASRRRCNKFRPYKLESECRCCNEKRVCQEYTHLADTSTDEWFVDNSYTPKKILDTTPAGQTLCNSMTTNKCSISGITTIMDDTPIISTTSHKGDSTPTTVLDQSTKMSTKTSTKMQKREKTENPKEDSDDNFEIELQNALKVSKELYEKEQKKMLKKKKENLDKKREILPTKHFKTVERKPHRKRQLSEETLAANDENSQKSCKLKDSAEDNTAFLKPPTDWNSLIKNRNATIDGSEDTFFSVSTRVCNSTALPNDKPAGERQIDRDIEILCDLKTQTNLKRATARMILPTVVYEEESDEATTKSLKDTSNINQNDTAGKFRTTKLSKNASIDINSNEESSNHKVDTPRPKNKVSSTKIRKLSPEVEQLDKDEFVFAKPRGRLTNISKHKSDTKTGTETKRVNKNVTAVANKNLEFEGQSIEGNENSCNVEQNTEESNKKKQENKILPVEDSYREERNYGKQENYTDSQEFYNKNSDSQASITEVKKLKTNVSIKSNLYSDKSIELGENFKVKIQHSLSKKYLKHNEDSNLAKPQNVFVSESPSQAYMKHSSVHNSSSRVSLKDDRKKLTIDHNSLDHSDEANTSDFASRMQENNRQSKNKSKVIEPTLSRIKNTKNSNVSSTTLHSLDASSFSHKPKKSNKRVIFEDSSSSASEDENDCTIVSSTTNIEAPVPPTDTRTDAEATSTSRKNKSSDSQTTVSKSKSHLQETSYLASTSPNRSISHHPKKGILIYTPNNPTLAPAQSFSNDGCFFHITKEHLSSVIGEKPAEKFLKYYIGRRRFNKNSTIYFKPPAARVLHPNDASSSDSDDHLESIGQYGDLYESVGGAAAGNNNETDNGTQHS